MFRVKQLKAHVYVTCYLHMFYSLVEVLDVTVKIIEALMCYVGIIDVYFLFLIG